MMKLLLHNNSAMTAAALDATGGGAADGFCCAMLRFVVGDVGTSLALAYLPRFVGDGEGRRPLDTKAAQPTVRQVLRAGWCLSAVCVLAFDARGVAWFIAHVGPGGAAPSQVPAADGAELLQRRDDVGGALLATRDLRFLCTWYAGLGGGLGGAPVHPRAGWDCRRSG